MNKKNPYMECPVFDTEHFILRLVQEDDAADLLTCYSDPYARAIFNFDTCTSNFFYDTSNEIRECIKVWLDCYSREDFVRLAIVAKNTHRAVGTIEMFGMVGRYKTTRGILRLDIASKYEEAAYLNELISLCLNEFFDLFNVNQIVTKAIPEAVKRVDILKKLGFSAYDFPEREHYWMCAADGLNH
jgi:RimJ/RimL family protein N-acetyltransferase